MAFAGFPVAEEAAAFPLRSKRKEVDEVAEDFSEFSLLAPARKMRRLVADVPVTFDQPEMTCPAVFEEVDFMQEQSGAAATAAVPYSAPNNEMALVLYKPPTIPGLESGVHSGISFVVDSNFIASIKNKNRSFPDQSSLTDHSTRKAEDGEEEAPSIRNVTRASGTCLAVVPWFPSQSAEVDPASGSKLSLTEDWMDSGEEEEAMSMDVEEDMGVVREAVAPPAASSAPVGMEPFGGLQQWQQQHCMYPNPPPNASTPLTWSW